MKLTTMSRESRASFSISTFAPLARCGLMLLLLSSGCSSPVVPDGSVGDTMPQTDTVGDAGSDVSGDALADVMQDTPVTMDVPVEADVAMGCTPTQTLCGASCVDTRTSASNCGECGRTCPTGPNAGPSCVDGRCALSCAPGFADCDGVRGTGCETETAADPGNCGMCGVSCTAAHATSACVMGACRIGSCTAGFLDCDMRAANGCEVDGNADAANCGMCGVACPMGQQCIRGMCSACNSPMPRVLIFGPAGTLEQPFLPTGSMVTVATEAMWRSMTTTNFAMYDLIVIGDLAGSGPGPMPLQVLFDTRTAWGPAIVGRVLVQSLDPGYHGGPERSHPGAQAYMRAALAWTARGRGTGLYASADWGVRGFDYLSPIGTFRSENAAGDSTHIMAPTHPVLAGSTDASMSGWMATYHAAISLVPMGFDVLVVERDSPLMRPLVVARDPGGCSP